MRIVLIYGGKHVGKTTTCKRLLEWLNSQGCKQFSYHSFDKPEDNWYGDFCAKGTYNGKTIQVYSPGDESAHLRRALATAK